MMFGSRRAGLSLRATFVYVYQCGLYLHMDRDRTLQTSLHGCASWYSRLCVVVSAIVMGLAISVQISIDVTLSQQCLSPVKFLLQPTSLAERK